MLYRIWKVLTKKYLSFIYKIDAEKFKNKYPEYLRKIGINIAEDYRDNGHGFIHPSVYFDGNDYSLISIGKNTSISADVVLLTHDYSITKGIQAMGDNSSVKFLKTITIGENSFIGMRSIILPGSRIGNNVIIGAGSIVSGNIPDNVVVVGNPAKIICGIEEWTEKHIKKQDFIYDKKG